MKPVALAIGLLLSALLLGCGGDKKPAVDAAPFQAALEEFLRVGSMDMKPDTFESITIEGDSATAKVRMASKDNLYGMKPLWTVTFAKSAKGWQVLSYKP
jgi:hypothetical protein